MRVNNSVQKYEFPLRPQCPINRDLPVRKLSVITMLLPENWQPVTAKEQSMTASDSQ